MATPAAFRFEHDPELPGSDRASKHILAFLRRATRLFWDLRIEGSDRVPLDGPAVICPNHLSFCDSVFVPASLPRRAWAVGKAEYMDDWKTRHLFPAMGMIPIDRSGGDSAKAALDTAARVLERDHLFMIYPEGTRSRSGNLHKGRTGAARLAIRCNAPIIPVGVRGTVAIQPPDSFLMKPFKPCTVKFGEPMWATDHGSIDDPRLARSFTDAVMFEISKLSGQTYVDVYAGRSPTPEPDKPAVPLPPGRTGNTRSSAATTSLDTGRSLSLPARG